MSKIIFYGINGVGLGHLARLSLVQRHIEKKFPQHTTKAICRSSMGPIFFTCPCIEVGDRGRDLGNALNIRGVLGTLKLVVSRFIPNKRTTIFFDTMWHQRVLKRLHFGKHKTILITDVNKPEFMYKDLQLALQYFEHIFIPATQKELEFHYKDHPKLWELLKNKKCKAAGPFVRLTETSNQDEKVIFTLGGGGDHHNEGPKYSVQGYLEQFIKAAHKLSDAGLTNLYLAKGPLMDINIDLGPLKVLETMNLPEHFGPNTTVVTRGTYNLTWEAIAQGAKLVTTERSTLLKEYAESRNEFLEQEGYAYYAKLDGEKLANAILKETPKNLSAGQNLIMEQKGLQTVCAVITQ